MGTVAWTLDAADEVGAREDSCGLHYAAHANMLYA
jgi:hypothetical protein